MMRTTPITLLVLLVASGSIGRAQDANTAVDARVDVTQLTVGDRVTLTLTVGHERGESVTWPEAPDQFPPFELMGMRVVPLPDSGGPIYARAEYTLTAFELGELQVPSVEVGITSVTGEETRVVLSPPVSLTVQSVQPDSSDIVDIKAPLAIARNWLLLLPWVGLAALIFALGYWGYRRYSRRGSAAAPIAPRPQRPAHVVAYEALDRLEGSTLLERGQIKRYYSDVSEIMRVYIEGRYGVVAMEMTSRDILWALGRVGSIPLERFREFFTSCDLVKFAKLRPAIDVCRMMVPMARELIDSTCEPDIDVPSEPVSQETDADVSAVTV